MVVVPVLLVILSSRNEDAVLMKRKVFMVIQTITLIIAIIVSSFPMTVVQATEIEPAESLANNAESAPDTPAVEFYGVDVPSAPSTGVTLNEGTPLPQGNPLTLDAGDPSSEIAAPMANPNAFCGLNSTVMILREDSATFPDPSLYPLRRPAQLFDVGEGWDFAFAGPTGYFPRPGQTGLPGPNKWDTFPTGDPNDPPARFLQYLSPSNPGPRLNDVRVDPRGNFYALRGEQLYAVVVITNNSWEPLCQSDPNAAATLNGTALTSPQVGPGVPSEPGPGFPTGYNQIIPAGLGQDLRFHEISLSIGDGGGGSDFLTQVLTPDDFYNTYNGTLLSANGDLVRRAPRSIPFNGDSNRYGSSQDYIALVPFTVPDNAVNYLEATVFGLQFQCTTNACSAAPFTDDETNYYVAPLGGLWLWASGDANPSGTGSNNPYNNTNPFRLVNLVGAGQRSLGDTAWFVLEVRNKWDITFADGTDTRSIRSITQTGGSALPACDGATGTADPKEGWYSSVVVDPVNGPVAGPNTVKLPNAGANSPSDIGLAGGESVYCVFKLVLNSSSAGFFNFNSTLEAESYAPGSQTAVTKDIDLVIQVPVQGASIQVIKRIIDPLVGSPPAPDLVRPGDIVTYEIEIRNTGEVPLNKLRISDSLIGPYIFDPAQCIIPGESATVQLPYTVKATDPNPIFNVATGFANVTSSCADLAGAGIEVTAVGSASILQAAAEFQVNLTAVGNISNSATPVLGTDNSVIYTMSYFNNGQLPFTKIEFIGISGQAGTFYPRLKNPGAMAVYLPNNSGSGGHPGYPELAMYADSPPTSGSALIRPLANNPFEPNGTFTPIRWEYTLPDLPTDPNQPITGYPLFQEVILEATRSDGGTVRGTATLVTEVENPNVDLNVELWDPVIDQPRTGNTVLRGENLSFNINVNLTEPTARCDVFVRQYVLDPATGIQTLVNPDIQLNWSIANQISAPGTYSTSTNALRPIYPVSDTSPDPLVMIFEFDARKGCSPANDNRFLVERVVLQYDVSNVNIDTELIVVTSTPNSTTQVTSGIYPRTGISPSYQLLYRATNQGPLNPDIIEWKYCIVSSPVATENCDSDNDPNNGNDNLGGISMFDGRENGFPDFGVAAGSQFGDISRKFTTFPPRIDRRIFQLQGGLAYPNPLVIQVVLQVSETGRATDITVVRETLVFPLSSDDLQFQLNNLGRSNLVRGDHNVPIGFSFQNTGSTTLTDVQVVNLANQATGGATIPAITQISPLGPYAVCRFLDNSTLLPTLAPGVSAEGTCEFDFTDDVPDGNFRAMVIAKEQGSGRDVFDLRNVEFTVLPHLEVEKEGLSQALNSDNLDYTVTVTNNSEFQHVDFDNLTGFADVFTPAYTNSTLCVIAGNSSLAAADLCPNTITQIRMEFLDGLTDMGGGIYRLPPKPSASTDSLATISYRLQPGTGGSHAEEEYENVATIQGERDYDPNTTDNETLVAGSDEHSITLACPIQWTVSSVPGGPGRGEDRIYTLGEEVTVTVQAVNLSGAAVTFDELYDPRMVIDAVADPSSVTKTSFRDLPNLVWPNDVDSSIPVYTLPALTPGDIPIPLTYTFNMRINTPDFIADELLFADYIREWILAFETSGPPDVGGCTYSGRGLSVEQLGEVLVREKYGDTEHRLIGLPIRAPVRTPKRLSIPPTQLPLVGEGQEVYYSIIAWNISETTDILVQDTEETLFNRPFVINYCNSRPTWVGDPLVELVPVCSSTTNSVSGTLWAWDSREFALPDIRDVVGLADPLELGVAPASLPPYIITPQDVEAEEIANQAIERYRRAPGSGPSWLLDDQIATYFSSLVKVEKILEVTETVIVPANNITARPGLVLYLVTVTNTSDELTITNIELSNLFGPSFVYPICGVTPGFIPAPDLSVTPSVCLPNYPITLAPLQGVSVYVNLPVPATYPDPTIITQTAARGQVIFDGVPSIIEAESGRNTVQVENSGLTLKHQIFATRDGQGICRDPYVNVTIPDRDKNDDGIPEVEVGGIFYYGFNLFVEGNRTFKDIAIVVDMIGTGNNLLTAAAAQALIDLAAAGTNPNVFLDGAPAIENVRLRGGSADESVPEAALCIPSSGFTQLSRNPDPLIINTTINAVEANFDLPVTFTTSTTPLTPQEKGLMVDKNLTIDITDPNIFITKTAEPATAFPGQVVTYTITIRNLTANDILVQDVWDSQIGVGQQFFDYDSNPATPPTHLRYQQDGQSSIPFNIFQSTHPDGLGWSWTTPGVIPGNDPVGVTYKYQRLVTEIDPNPLINRAGVIGFIDNTPPNDDVPVEDEAINSLIVSNSQLNVVKQATPTSTVLGNSIFYEITITNIGDDPIYDLIVWDDRYNLEYANEGFISLIPNRSAFTPNGPNNSLLILGGQLLPAIPGTDSNRLDLVGQQDPNFSPTITIQYNLPVPPDCTGWTGAANEPYNSTTQTYTPNNAANPCADYASINDLPLIDPFINTAYAVGLKDNNGTVEYLDSIGYDRAVVDIINPEIEIVKFAASNVAAIGSDMTYTIRIRNTGDTPVRIDEVLERPDASTSNPVRTLIYGDCPVPNGVTTTPTRANLNGTKLLPFLVNGSLPVLGNPNSITIDNTAVLFPGCTAQALVTLVVPNPLPDNEYINLAEVRATDLTDGSKVRDVSFATVDLTASGLEISKRAWNCDTASNGALTPNTPLPDGTSICTVQTSSGGFLPGARQLSAANEGQLVYYEISIQNTAPASLPSGIFNSLQFTDFMMVDSGNGLEAFRPGVPNSPVTDWLDANNEVYTWQNGQLIIGLAQYQGFGMGTCPTPETGGPQTDDETYQCLPAYRGYNNGPFGVDDISTTNQDESYLFEPDEAFERPDPGPVAIPVITYPYQVNFPADDPDSDEIYHNRIQVITTPYDPSNSGFLGISNASLHALNITPATLQVNAIACAETDGNNNTFDGAPCVGVVRPGQDVWYRITLTSQSSVELEGIAVEDSVRGPIPVNDPCWTWPAAQGVLSAPGAQAVCTYRRGLYVATPLSVANDPYINSITVNYSIDTGVPPLLPGTPVTAQATIRVAESELLVTVLGCEDTVFAPSGRQLAFDIEVTNLSTGFAINNVQVFAPTQLGAAFNIPAAQTSIRPDLLQLTVSPLDDTIIIPVIVTGVIQENPTRQIAASTECTIQRADGDLVIEKSVVNPASGGTTVRPGDTVTYTIRIRNLNNLLEITNLDVNDPLLENAPLSQADWATAWPTTLPPREDITRTFQYQVTGIQDPVINVATASGLTAGITPVQASDEAQLNIASGNLIAIVTPSANPVTAGDTVVFNYQVCNTSTSTTYNLILLQDNAPTIDPIQDVLGNDFVVGSPIVPQQCRYFRRSLTTQASDAGTTVNRTLAVEGCPSGFTCPPTAIVSDSQTATVNIIAQPGPEAEIDVRLTADRIGLSAGDSVTYTLRITNLNTLRPASVTIPSTSLPNNIFLPTTYTLQPLQSVEQNVSYLFPGTPDPLLAEVVVGFTINSITRSRTARLSLPAASVPGSQVILNIQSLQSEVPVGGKVTYIYTATNIGTNPVNDAYLYGRAFIPMNTLDGNPTVTNCSPIATSDLWGLGTPLGGPINNYIPTLYGNGFSRTARIVCDIAANFQLTFPPTNLLHIAQLNRFGINPNPALAKQDEASLFMPVVAPIRLTMSASLGAPGGRVKFSFRLDNIGQSSVSGITLTAPLPDECVESAWINQQPTGTNSPWDPSGLTLNAGANLVATAECTLPETILTDLGATSFVYPATGQDNVEARVAGNIVDTADPVTISIVNTVRFEFIPPSNNPTLQFLRPNDVVTLTFRLIHTGAINGPIEGLQYGLDLNGNTSPCENVVQSLSTGETFNGTLPFGSTLTILCTLRIGTNAHGTLQVLNFVASHLLAGQTINLPVPNPLMQANVEDAQFTMTLGTGSDGGTTSAQVDDNGQLVFTLRITNTGQSPLANFSIAQSMLDQTKNGTSVSTSSFLGDLTDLVADECPLPLLPGETCTLRGASLDPDLIYRVKVSDPQKFIIKLAGTANSATNPNFTVSATSSWTGTVTRPIVELGGGGNSTNSNSSGNMWVVNSSLVSLSPNPAVMGQSVTFNIIIRNTGFRTLTGLSMTGTITTASSAAPQGIQLTRFGQSDSTNPLDLFQNDIRLASDQRQGATPTPTPTSVPVTLPASITFTIPATSLAPGQSTTATATWTVGGVTPPASINLISRFRATPDGNYPAYDLTLPAYAFQVAAVSAAVAGSTAAGLNPNATEPEITKTASVDSAFPGDSILWTITVRNPSTNPLTNVQINDAVPADLTIVDISTSAGASLANGNLVTVAAGTLAPGATITITLNTTVIDEAQIPGVITNTVCATREGGAEICADAEVALGPGGVLPDTGLGAASLQASGPKLAQRWPFALAIFGVLFMMLLGGGNITNRQRLILAVMALAVLALLIGSVLLLGGDSDQEEQEALRDGSPPPDAEEFFATATPILVPTETPTPTIAPTIPADALATLAAFPATATPYILPTPAGPRRLDIPSLNYAIPLPIVELPQYNGEWDVTNLGHNIGWLDNTTWFDPTWGNTVLVGHIQLSDTDPGPFKELERLVPGDEILVYEGSMVRRFLVEEIFTVGPTQMEVTHPTLDPMLTLITCTNWSDNRGVFSDRLVVRAKPVAEIAESSGS
jgi:LPXTG-site transpeptidase (sortase) family protein